MSIGAVLKSAWRAIVLCFGIATAPACELCAIYNSASARGGGDSGFVVGLAESFTSYQNAQYQGKAFPSSDYIDTSVTHLVGTCNFTDRLGLSLNLPLVSHQFRRSEVRFSDANADFRVERGSEFGVGDLALVGRVTLFQQRAMRWGLTLNLLGGVKFPTGDSSRIQDEVDQARRFQALLTSDDPHDPLGHSVSGVHEHRLALGSGSFDGIVGATLNARWERWFANAQFQYYARTAGESSFEYGDDLMVSGGPGRYLVVNDRWTLSLQANGAYETSARDRLLGKRSDYTGMTIWFLGPLLNLTWKEHLTANAGVDIPLSVASGGLQNVPSYRIHGGVSWLF